MEVLHQIQLDSKDIRITENLYWDQKANDRSDRWGRLDKIFKEALVDTEYEVKVNGVFLNTISYADDILIFCDIVEGVHQLINKVSAAGVEHRVNINVSETNFMVFSRKGHENA